jgi:dihydrofolate reductase
MKASVFIATSLDGFIAREDGTLDWLPGADGSAVEEHGYETFMSTVDVIIMGRHTYEKVLTFGEWPFGKRQVVVLASRPAAAAPSGATVEVMNASPRMVVTRLEEQGVHHAYVDGGRTIQAFLVEGLIQRLIITRVPVLLGRGIPLFGPLSRDVALRHLRTRDFPSGLVQSEYEVVV